MYFLGKISGAQQLNRNSGVGDAIGPNHSVELEVALEIFRSAAAAVKTLVS